MPETKLTDTPIVPDANAQAAAALPKPDYMAPAQDLLQGTKVQKAYDAAQSFLGEHAQHFSDKVLKPFREELDSMGEDLQNAGETSHTKTGGQLTEPTRALASGVGTLLKAVPVGKNVGDTLQANIVPPELEELGVELHPDQILEDAVRVKGVKVPPERDTGIFHEHIKKGGAVPGGIQKGDAEIGVPDLALFHDPATGSTLALPTDKVTPDNVNKQIQASRKQYLDAKNRAALEKEKDFGVELKPVTKNASGESAASQEAINRSASEKSQGKQRIRIDSRSGAETPLIGADAVDAKPGPYDHIVIRDSKGDIIQDSGPKARPLSGQPKPAGAEPKISAKPAQKTGVSKEDSKLAANYVAELLKKSKD